MREIGNKPGAIDHIPVYFTVARIKVNVQDYQDGTIIEQIGYCTSTAQVY